MVVKALTHSVVSIIFFAAFVYFNQVTVSSSIIFAHLATSTNHISANWAYFHNLPARSIAFIHVNARFENHTAAFITKLQTHADIAQITTCVITSFVTSK